MFSLQLENDSANIVNINDGVNYLVTYASGLNPPSASIFTAKSPNRKGTKYNGSTLDERNIVLSIKLLGNIEANRNALYDWVDTEQYIKVRYQNGTKNVYCEGYVQDCSIDLFTDNEVVSVAIICPNPYWLDLQEIAVDISSITNQFTLPFAISFEGVEEIEVENPDGSTATTYMNKGVPFSTVRESNTTTIFNGGNETGAKFHIKCITDIANFVIRDDKDATKSFAINTTLERGSIVIIDTESSPKTCKAYKPDGTVENLLKYLFNPTWFTLKKGTNIFSYQFTGYGKAEMTISFTNKYLGV